VKQPKGVKHKQEAKPPADRNAISARRSATMEPGQLTALGNSITQTSKEICPSSAFTIFRQLPVDGKQIEVHMMPNCMAAEALRGGASMAKTVGVRFKHCFLAGDGAVLREMLMPIDQMRVERASDGEKIGDLFD
jgi:hypothetical protein